MLDFLIDFALIIFLIGELVVLITALAFLASLFPRTARNAVLYIVSLVAYHYIPSYCLDFIGLCRDSSVPTVFILTIQSIYFFNYSSAYSIKSVLAYLIRLAKKVIYGTLEGLSQAMFYSCVFINLGFALLLFSTFNDYWIYSEHVSSLLFFSIFRSCRVYYNSPIYGSLLVLSSLWWSYLIRCQIKKYPRKRISINPYLQIILHIVLCMVSYVVNDFIVFCSDRFLPNFSDDQTPLVSLLVFCLVIILVYSISYNTIYLVKFAPEYLIWLAMDTIDNTLKVLRWALSYVFIAIDLVIILLYLSVLNGHLVDLNAPLVTLLLLLSVVWWTCLISCQFINYPKKYISTSLIPWKTLNVVLYIVSLVVYYHAELYYPEFMYICGDDNIPFIFLLLSILVYSIGYSTAYLVKFAPDSLIRLAKKSFGGILKGLSQGLSLFFIAINLYSIMIYLSAINGYLVDFNLPLFTLLLLLSIVWWSYLISCQVDKYAQKYIKITFLYNKNTFQKVFYLCKFFIKKFFR